MNVSDDLPELLASMFETMKRHEKAIIELIVEVECLRSLLTKTDAGRLQLEKLKILTERSRMYDNQISGFDEIIERLRGV